jgi:hypothetical protein
VNPPRNSAPGTAYSVAEKSIQDSLLPISQSDVVLSHIRSKSAIIKKWAFSKARDRDSSLISLLSPRRETPTGIVDRVADRGEKAQPAIELVRIESGRPAGDPTIQGRTLHDLLREEIVSVFGLTGI